MQAGLNAGKRRARIISGNLNSGNLQLLRTVRWKGWKNGDRFLEQKRRILSYLILITENLFLNCDEPS